MSYLAQQTSNTEFGVVKIGNNIGVDEGVIYLNFVAGPGVSIANTPGEITISANGADIMAVYGTTTNYTATANDEYIGVNSASAVTITLPTGTQGRVYTIKDEYGQGSGKITIQPTSPDKIDNALRYIISVPYRSVSAVYRAGQWRII